MKVGQYRPWVRRSKLAVSSTAGLLTVPVPCYVHFPQRQPSLPFEGDFVLKPLSGKSSITCRFSFLTEIQENLFSPWTSQPFISHGFNNEVISSNFLIFCFYFLIILLVISNLLTLFRCWEHVHFQISQSCSEHWRTFPLWEMCAKTILK